jgi:YgiT-type zinc finger domain-containing protein
MSKTISHQAEIKHDGRLHTIQIPDLPVMKCNSCGEVFFNTTSHNEISQALRRHLNLLSPEQIRDELKAHGLMQKTFAQQIRVAQETVSRWLSGTYIQSCAMDQLMRMFFRYEAAKCGNSSPGEAIKHDG